MVVQVDTKFYYVCYVVGALLIIVGIAACMHATYPWSRFWLCARIIFLGCLLILVGIIRHALEKNHP